MRSLPGYSFRRVVVDLGRHIFEVFLMLLALLTGLMGLSDPSQIAPGEPLLPTWGRVLWYSGLTIGAVITLVGLLMPLPAGHKVERTGLMSIMGPGLAYVLLAIGNAAVFHAVVVGGFVVTLAVRIYYLIWEPKAIVAAVRLLKSELDETP